MEHVLAAVDVVPPADVGANQVLAQHPLDDFLLQRELGALVQHLDLQRAARDAHRFLEHLQQRAHELRFLPRLDLRDVVVDARAVLLLRLVVVQRVDDKARDHRGHFLAVDVDLAVAQVQPGDAVEDRRPLLLRRVDLVGPLLGRVLVRLTVPLVREDRLQVLPRFVELRLVVAARILPVPHPLRRAAVERAERHAEIDRWPGALEPRTHHVRRNRHRRADLPCL